jgi:hypothetical protein
MLFEVEVATDGQSASLSWHRAPIRNLRPDFSFLSDSCGFLDVGHPLWRENWSVICLYNCFWAFPEQSLSGPSHTELTTIFYTVSFETPPTWRARSPYLYPPGRGWPSYTPRHWVPFSPPLRLAGLRWRYSNPPPLWRYTCICICICIYISC